MGSGSSALIVREQQKPVDVSDIPNGDWVAAKNEVARLREILSLVDVQALHEEAASLSYRHLPSAGPVASQPNKMQRKTLHNPDDAIVPPSSHTKHASTTPAHQEQYGEDKTSNFESAEGKAYWSSLGNTIDPQLSSTGNVKEREFGTEASSNNESAEGAAYWSSLSGHDATNLSPQFADRPHTGAFHGTPYSKHDTGTMTAKKLVELVKVKVYERYDSLREAFLKMDYDKSGYISREEFRTTMADMGLPLTDDDFDLIDSSFPHQIIDTIQLYQTSFYDPDRGISYLEFIKLMSDQLKYVPPESEMYYGDGDSSLRGSSSAGRSHLSSSRPATSLENDGLSRLRGRFNNKIFSTFNDVKTAFKEADTDHSGFIEIDEFYTLLRDKLGLKNATKEDILELMALFDTNNDGRLSYAEFLKCLHTY